MARVTGLARQLQRVAAAGAQCTAGMPGLGAARAPVLPPRVACGGRLMSGAARTVNRAFYASPGK